MAWDDFQLLAPRGAGPDGAVYQAQTANGDAVVVCVLDGARANAERWHTLRRRLTLAAWVVAPGAVRIVELALDAEPPFAVLDDAAARPLERTVGPMLPLPLADAVVLTRELAVVLSEAHRLGLIHGDLRPGTILVSPDSRLQLDFSTLQTRPTDQADTDVPTRPFRAPELGLTDRADDSSADVYSLGAVLRWLLTGGRDSTSTDSVAAGNDALARLLAEVLSDDPDARPSAHTVAERLGRLADDQGATAPGVIPPEVGAVPAVDALVGGRLGRFQLVEKLGEGGMGAVYRGIDPTDGQPVAVKVIRAALAASPQALRRFHKEARLLAQVRSPYVANLIEFNEDNGVRYMVAEFVAGRSLRQHLTERGQLGEKEALGYLADAARGLRGAHERGIVHRDVKPENIILPEGGVPRARLLDFGLAREIVQSESQQLTRAESPLGTPLYMAPEQCVGKGTVTPATDVYSLGVTLYHLLAGRPPFQAPDPLGTLLMHCTDPVPPLRQFNPAVSDALCEVVAKALAKESRDRYADAAAFVDDLERLLRGEPTQLAVHPQRPTGDPTRVMRYAWTWELASSPAELWPHVSNTERLNRAAGLPAVQFTTKPDPAGGSRRFAETSKAGVTNRWREHPFEWVEGRRLGVLREFEAGVFRWFVSTVDLVPRPGGGTTLTHRVELEPVGLFGKLVGAVEVGFRARRNLAAVYRRIDAALASRSGAVDPFEPPVQLTGRRRRRLDALLQALIADGVEDALAHRLGEFLASAPDQEVARIRPLALAQRLGVDGAALVDACLRAVPHGLLTLLWDILCPLCRIPTQVQDTLRQLQAHAQCEACNLDFQLDFAQSVEMIFRVHPEIRPSELRSYCVGGPAHSSHVVSQVRVPPGKRTELALDLAEGAYRLRGPQLPFTFAFQVGPTGRAERSELSLTSGPEPDLPHAYRVGGPTFVLTNDGDRELVVRVERAAPRQDALTAARASTLPLFRSLFPAEILAPGQLVSVSTLTFLVTRLDGIAALTRDQGEAAAFAVVHDHLQRLEERVRAVGGALIKSVGAGALTTFDDPVAALRVALELQPTVAASGPGVQLAVEYSAARRVATLDGRMDYFGGVVQQAVQFAATARGGELVLGPKVAADTQVAALLRQRSLFCTPVQASAEEAAVRVTVQPAATDPAIDADGAQFHLELIGNPTADLPELGPLRNRFLEALARFCRELSGPDDPEARRRRADDFLRLAAAAARISSKENALAFYRQAQALLAPLAADYPDDRALPMTLARCYNNIANLQQSTGRRDLAATALRHALTIYGRRPGGPGTPFLSTFGVGAVCYNLGVLAGQTGDGTAAVWYDRAVQALRGVPPESRDYAQAQAFLRNAERRGAKESPPAEPPGEISPPEEVVEAGRTPNPV